MAHDEFVKWIAFFPGDFPGLIEYIFHALGGGLLAATRIYLDR
jgi:hypothetical protein